MEGRSRRRPSGETARCRDRRGLGADHFSASRAPPPRAPHRPRVTGGSGPRLGNRQQLYPARKPLRRSVESIMAEARMFTPSLGISPAALHRANNSKYTGLHHCCGQCTPGSKSKYSGSAQGMCGLINILEVDRRGCRRLPHRLAPFISFVVQQPMPYHMIDHRNDTLSSARVQQAIQQCAQASLSDQQTEDSAALRRAEREQEKRAAGIVSSMSSAVWRPLVRVVAWLFLWAFGKLFGRLYIQQSHIAMMAQAQQRGVPMVFLPNHKSHMDYLIMTFVLFSIGVRIPRIAAGDNLRLPFVSWLVTHLGGFFIKRRLDSSVGKDVLYRTCLHEYMLRVLQAGENMEFFLEGSRSRSGKPCSPKAGLLSVVVDAVKEGVVEDVLLVPVNISYDKILERNFVKFELMGGVKKQETVREAVKGAWSMITCNVGGVRVDFAQPFSLQEYLSKAVVSGGSLLELSCSSQRRSIVSLSQHSHRKLVTALSYHIMYDISQCISLTSTGMVAFILLYKHREHGASVDELVESYLQLEKMTESRGRVVGCFREASEAVHYALHRIHHLVTVDNAPCQQPQNGVVADGNQKLRPLLELPDVFDLYHLANQVTPLLALEAVVARSVLAVALEGRKSKKGISGEKVLDKASFLAQMMAREFFPTPPCAELGLALQEVIDGFVNSELLKRVESGHQGNQKRVQLEYEDEDWEEFVPDVHYQLSGHVGVQAQLCLLSSVLEPLVESYWLVATQLLLTMTPPHTSAPHLSEPELVTQLQKTAEGKAKKGLLSRVESSSSETLRNSVKMLRDLDVLVPVQNGDTIAQNQALRVANSNRLVDIIKKLTLLRS